MRQYGLFLTLLVLTAPLQAQDYVPTDRELKAVLLDTDPRESFLSVRADSAGQLFVGGREALFVYEPDPAGLYRPRQLLYRFPPHSWVYDIEVRGDDLYVLTLSALYVLKAGRTQREGLRPRRLVWGVPLGHVHQCFHALAWGPEGDLYISMGDVSTYYGDFNRPDHWVHWTFFSQPEGTRTPYNGVGAVLRCKPDGSDLQVVARGLRNPCGLAFDHHWNLFSNDNDHEGLPALFVPGRLLHVTPHADFAWPRGWMAEKTPERADLLETMFAGMGRAVPVGQAYYDETLLPAQYRHSLLVARWGIRAVTRYPLERRGASFKATEHTLLAGKDQARPVGVCVGRGGRIFVTIAYMAHNEASPIYKSDLVMVTRADDDPKHPFEPYEATTATTDRLWAELGDPSWQRRYRAQIEIQRRGGEPIKDANRRLLDSLATDPALHPLIWLAAASQESSLHLLSLLGHKEPLVRRQALRALTEFPEQLNGQLDFTRQLRDADSGVVHAALLAYFSPKVPWIDAAFEQIVDGPARSKDTYLRQTAARLLAAKATACQLTELCEEDDATRRLAGVLAAGFRLTVPAATGALAEELPLAKLREESAYVVEYADAKVDLGRLGRIGNYTLAEHWKAGKHSAAQEQLFDLLRRRLADKDESVRLQAAHFLALLNDPRSEPELARVRSASAERRLAAAPIRGVDRVWAVGPFTSGKIGPRQPIDLDAIYADGERKLRWEVLKRSYRFSLSEALGSADHASYYVFTRLDSLTRQPAQLLTGSDGGLEVWHNGRRLWAKEMTRSALPYQDVIPLELQPGGNALLVRVSGGALYLHYRALGSVAQRLPEKLAAASLAERLRDGGKDVVIGKEFLDVDWTKAAAAGDSMKGRQLFSALACARCHAITPNAAILGGPSLAEAGMRFTVPYLVEAILLPGKQVSPVFRATLVETKAGRVLTGLVVGETAEKLELLLLDGMRQSIPMAEVSARRLVEQSPMPPGLVRRPEELRDLLAYLLSADPEAP
jgi:putative heme-binding domain-containing protein